MRPSVKMRLSLLFCVLSLTACQHRSPEPRKAELKTVTVPYSVLLPTEGPTRPHAGATQKDAALVIEGFREALNSCNADKATLLNVFGLIK